MIKESDLSRREFVLGIASIGATFATDRVDIFRAIQKEVLANSEYEISRGVNGDERLLEILPADTDTIREQNYLWANLFKEQNIDSPGVVLAGATHYSSNAVSYEQLRIKTLSFKQKEQNTDKEREVIRIWEHFENNGLEEVLARYELKSPEFAQWFDMELNRAGYDGVLATKTVEDFGKVYQLEVWDNRLKRWRGKDNGEKFRMIVLDMAREDTYIDKINESYVALLAWYSDFAVDPLKKIGLDPAGQPFAIRGLTEELSGLKVNWPELGDEEEKISQLYQALGRSLRQVLANPRIYQVAEDALNLDDNTLSVNVAGVIRTRAVDKGFMTASIFSQVGLPLVWEPDTNTYKKWTENSEDPEEVGLPMSAYLLHDLLYAWKTNEILDELRGNTQIPIPISRLKSGIFEVVEMESQYTEELRKIGVCVETDDAVKLIFYDDNNRRMREVIINEQSDYRKVLFDEGEDPTTNRIFKLLY